MGRLVRDMMSPFLAARSRLDRVGPTCDRIILQFHMLGNTREQWIFSNRLFVYLFGNHAEVEIPLVRNQRFQMKEYDRVIVVGFDPFKLVRAAALRFHGNSLG